MAFLIGVILHNQGFQLKLRIGASPVMSSLVALNVESFIDLMFFISHANYENTENAHHSHSSWSHDEHSGQGPHGAGIGVKLDFFWPREFKCELGLVDLSNRWFFSGWQVDWKNLLVKKQKNKHNNHSYAHFWGAYLFIQLFILRSLSQ